MFMLNEETNLNMSINNKEKNFKKINSKTATQNVSNRFSYNR